MKSIIIQSSVNVSMEFCTTAFTKVESDSFFKGLNLKFIFIAPLAITLKFRTPNAYNFTPWSFPILSIKFILHKFLSGYNVRWTGAIS